jgi:hypothetical protein
MVIKYRNDLKDSLKNNVVPDGRQFDALINSVLVKRDDQFFGKWQSGMGYANGDVVLWQKTFYYFQKPEKTAVSGDCDDCGNIEPKKDSCCWKPVRFDVNDEDWIFDNEKRNLVNKPFLMAAPTDKVGIGTDKGDDVAAFFHINDNKRGGGQLLFNPLETDGKHLPMLKMRNLSIQPKIKVGDDEPPKDTFVSQSLDEKKVIFLTNTEGYLFRQAQTNETVRENSETHESNRERGMTDAIEKPLLFMGSENQNPRVGIGTSHPKATLDLNLNGRGQIRADAGEDNVPDITLVNKSNGQETYLSETISTEQATLVTNAPEGFVFKTDHSHTERFHKHGHHRTESGRSLMVVKPDETTHVRVGIGTIKPATQVEVDGKEGKIQMSLNDINPSLNIINKIEKLGQPTDSNFLALGAMGALADQQAVFSTNSQSGFVFRHTQQQGGGVPNVNRGTKFLYLRRDKSSKESFSMIMDGRVAAKGIYAAAAPDEALPLAKDNALKYIKALKPTYYSASGEDERQFGFLASEMPSGLEGMVKDFDGLGKEDYGIAYHSIVALLVGAVKDLSATVEQLNEKVKELENRGGHKK